MLGSKFLKMLQTCVSDLKNLVPRIDKSSFDGTLFSTKYFSFAVGDRRARRQHPGTRNMADCGAKICERGLQNKVAVVTGAASGLGRATVEALCERALGRVYLTARDAQGGAAAVARLQYKGLTPKFHLCDVTDETSVATLANHLKQEYGGFDYLVNNAGVLDYDTLYPTFVGAKRNIDVNYRSLRIIERHLLPILRDDGRVVNISSACGHLSNLRNERWLRALRDPELTAETIDSFVDEYLELVRSGDFRREDFADDGKHAEHRVSKIALTALTRIWAKKLANRGIKVNALHPGHLRTAMSRGGGAVPPECAASLVVSLLLDAPAQLSGAFMWHDRSIVHWTDHTTPLYYVHQDLALQPKDAQKNTSGCE